MSQLEEHLIETDPDELAPAVPFVILDEGQAIRSLRVLAKNRREIAHNEQLARDEIERIAAWVDEVNAPLLADVARQEGYLTEWHQAQLTLDPTKKTIKLPTGTLSARKGQDKVDVDEPLFIAWAETAERDDFLRTKVSIDVNAVKEAVYKDGEILPHVTKVEGSIGYSVKTTEVTK